MLGKFQSQCGANVAEVNVAECANRLNVFAGAEKLEMFLKAEAEISSDIFVEASKLFQSADVYPAVNRANRPELLLIR